MEQMQQQYKKTETINKQYLKILYTACITEINNTQVDNAKDLDFVMLIYNLIAIIIQEQQEVYGNIIKMSQFILC